MMNNKYNYVSKRIKTHIMSNMLFILSTFLFYACNPIKHKEILHPSIPKQERDYSWPRQINTSRGVITLDAPAKRIVSTSVTLTGALLAIDAPIIATSILQPNSSISDENGFLLQWGQVAKDKGVKALYNTEPDLEAIAMAQPDLIVVTSTAGDSAMQVYSQLNSIAPVVVINYDDKSWQDVVNILAYITGKDQQAKHIIATFNQRVEQIKKEIKLPPQPVTALVYQLNGQGANIWTADSAQGSLLLQLGFTLATVPDNIETQKSQGIRKDIIQITGERLDEALTGQTLLLFSANDHAVKVLKSNPFLAHIPAVKNNQVYSLGIDTFRLDYYSANNILDRLEHLFITQH